MKRYTRNPSFRSERRSYQRTLPPKNGYVFMGATSRELARLREWRRPQKREAARRLRQRAKA
jgi:hypothetical protein